MIAGREFRSHETINDAYVWGLLEHARSLIFRARELELAQFGITIEQMSILHAILINDGSATIDEVASITVRQHNSVSTLVNRMIKSGLIKKVKPLHEKKYLLLMTDKAHRTVEKIPRKSIEMAFSCLSKEEKAQLATSLEHLTENGHELLGHNFNLPFLTKESATMAEVNPG